MKLIQSGIRSANIVIVGEAPGSTEAATGQPFVGGAGQILDSMLGRVGILRRECFITNVCHVQPPGNNFEWFYKKGMADYIRGVVQLKNDLADIKPNLVIALGNHPMRALTGKMGITKWRGSLLPCTLVPGLKVLCTYHPAAIMRTWEYKGVAEVDLIRALEESNYPELIYPERTFYLPNGKITCRQGADWVTEESNYDRFVLAEELSKQPWLSVDIECIEESPGNWVIDCVGFSDVPERALVLDARDRGGRFLIERLCKCPAKKIYQNGTFDMTVLSQNGIETTNFEWDTMLAHHALYPECASGGDEMTALQGKKRQSAIGKGLAFLTTFYTREPYYKDDGKLWKVTGDKDIFYRYNALDCAVTREIQQVQVKDIASFDVGQTAQREFNLVEPLMEATKFGIKIDMDLRAKIKSKLQTEVDNLQAFLNTAAKREINVKSSKDIPKLLYEDLNLPKQYNKKTKNVTADADAIVKLAGKHKHPVLMTILKIRERRDLIERYANAPVDVDGRMRCSFDITGTRSGRLSSRVSIFGSGTNLQTIPENMRAMFIADPGHVLIYRDFSQAEARVVAALSNDDYLLDLFADPTRDIHRETASKIFGKPVSEITDAERYLGKKVRHAVNYGMDAGRFVEVVNSDFETTGIRIDLATARRVIDGFFMLHANHKAVYWKGIERALSTTRTLNTCFGRKRTFFARWSDKMVREGYSYVPQSTIGDLCNVAVIRIYRKFRGSSTRVLLAVHDSILVQTPEGSELSTSEEMEDCMNIPLQVNGHTITIPTDCMIGYNWGYKSDDNPLGLVKLKDWKASHAET